jgi:two-component system NarL family response regulator
MAKPEKKRTSEGAPGAAAESKKRVAGADGANLIRVLVADDHTVLRDGLVALLNQEEDMNVVADTGNGQEAVDLWKRHRPDITLMDLKMPGLDGVDAIYRIRAAEPRARIIVLTTFDGEEDIYRGMRAGAKSYLLKDVRREELFRCVREVHAGRTYIPPAVAAKLVERLPGEELTPRELEVLRLVAEGKPNKLIGADLAISEVTVKSHVQSVFRKLNVLSRTEAIAVANRTGLIRV